MDISSFSIDDILEYYMYSGQEYRAIELWRQVGPSVQFDAVRAEAIVDIKRAALNRNFELTWELLLALDPAQATQSEEVELIMLLAQVAEQIIRKQNPLDVVNFVKATVVPLLRQLDDKPNLQEYFGQIMNDLVAALIVPEHKGDALLLLDPFYLSRWVLTYLEGYFRTAVRAETLIQICIVKDIAQNGLRRVN